MANTVDEQSLAEAAIGDIKRVLEHESAELYRESQTLSLSSSSDLWTRQANRRWCAQISVLGSGEWLAPEVENVFGSQRDRLVGRGARVHELDGPVVGLALRPPPIRRFRVCC